MSPDEVVHNGSKDVRVSVDWFINTMSFITLEYYCMGMNVRNRGPIGTYENATDRVLIGAFQAAVAGGAALSFFGVVYWFAVTAPTDTVSAVEHFITAMFVGTIGFTVVCGMCAYLDINDTNIRYLWAWVTNKRTFM